jgi:hypothetical protein
MRRWAAHTRTSTSAEKYLVSSVHLRPRAAHQLHSYQNPKCAASSSRRPFGAPHAMSDGDMLVQSTHLIGALVSAGASSSISPAGETG